MDWRAINDVVKVAEAGSLSAAARRLNTSQPTVGRRIEALEQQLGAVLFTRTSQGLFLTAVGEQVIRHAKRMEEEALAIERTATGANQSLQGVVRISLIEDIGIHWLPQKLAQFHQRFSHLTIDVNIDNRDVNLLRREADIAVRLARPQQPDLICRKVGSIQFGLYASEAYVQRYGIPANPAQLKHHFHIGFDEHTAQTPQVKYLESLFGQDRVRHRSNSHMEILEATRAGIGCGVFCCFLAAQHRDLRRILRQQIYHDREIWLVTHADVHRSARIRTLFDCLIDWFKQDAQRLAGHV